MPDGFDPVEEAIEEALGENLREHDLAEMVAALEVRRETYERELKTAGDDRSRKQWQARITEISAQIDALRKEQAISGFVERSVRASSTRPRPLVDLDDVDYG